MRHLVGRQLAVDVVAHRQRRGQRTGADAPGGGQAEQAVLGRFPFLDPQFLLQRGDDGLRTAHVAAGAAANHDLVLAARDHGEKMVEGDNAIHVRDGQLQRGGDVAEHIGAEITEHLLRRVQHLDQRGWLVVVAFNRAVEVRKPRVAARVGRIHGRDARGLADGFRVHRSPASQSLPAAS